MSNDLSFRLRRQLKTIANNSIPFKVWFGKN